MVIYATHNGRTGHAGIAVDNYRQTIREKSIDTMPTGALTYYDLWPKSDVFRFGQYRKNREAEFYLLPNQRLPEPVTVTSLYDEGIPHKEFYPCDALMMFRTTPAVDERLKQYLDSMLDVQQVFNARSYNCSDFVRQALLQIIPDLPQAKEFIPFSFSTTPNKLCRRLLARDEVVVLKSPGRCIRQPFILARILKSKPPSNLLASR